MEVSGRLGESVIHRITKIPITTANMASGLLGLREAKPSRNKPNIPPAQIPEPPRAQETLNTDHGERGPCTRGSDEDCGQVQNAHGLRFAYTPKTAWRSHQRNAGHHGASFARGDPGSSTRPRRHHRRHDARCADVQELGRRLERASLVLLPRTMQHRYTSSHTL